jgi:hypothetical protein
VELWHARFYEKGKMGGKLPNIPIFRRPLVEPWLKIDATNLAAHATIVSRQINFVASIFSHIPTAA